jgi:hypothetical protein
LITSKRDLHNCVAAILLSPGRSRDLRTRKPSSLAVAVALVVVTRADEPRTKGDDDIHPLGAAQAFEGDHCVAKLVRNPPLPLAKAFPGHRPGQMNTKLRNRECLFD